MEPLNIALSKVFITPIHRTNDESGINIHFPVLIGDGYYVWGIEDGPRCREKILWGGKMNGLNKEEAQYTVNYLSNIINNGNTYFMEKAQLEAIAGKHDRKYKFSLDGRFLKAERLRRQFASNLPALPDRILM